MDENKHGSFNTLHVLSERNAVTVEGSINVKNNIIVERDLIIDGFISTPDIETTKECILINRNIVSNKKTDRYDLGENKRRWNNIYSNKIESYQINSKELTTSNLLVNNDIYLDETNIFSKDNLVMSIDNDHISLKTNVFDVNGLFTVNKDSRHVLLNGFVMAGMIRINNYIQLTPQKLIAKNTGKIVVLGSLILTTIENSCIIELVPPDGILFSDTVVKLVIESVIKGNIRLNIDEKHVILNKHGDYVEILLSGVNSTYIGGNCELLSKKIENQTV